MNYHEIERKKIWFDLLNENKIAHEYIIYDSTKDKIEINDKLIIILKEDKNKYIKFKVKNIYKYANYNEVFLKYWNVDFINNFESIDQLIREWRKNYDLCNIIHFEIWVLEIERDNLDWNNMNVLFDTNIIIYRESHNNINMETINLFKLLDKLKFNKLIHEETIKEIEKYKKNDSIYKKIKVYNEIKNSCHNSFYFDQKIESTNIKNDIVDNKILYSVFCSSADVLITNDNKILKNAENLYLKDRVFSSSEFLNLLENKFPKLITYPILNIQCLDFHDVNLNSIFFDDFRKKYYQFDEWFKKKYFKDKIYVIDRGKDILGCLYLKIEDISETYDDIIPKFSKIKRLKIGMLKVVKHNLKFGERFLKIAFDNAIKNKVSEIYITFFNDNKNDEIIKLINLLNSWGFVKHGIKTTKMGDEEVYTKDMINYNYNENPRFNFPILKKNSDIFILPIQPEYHTQLFTDMILSNEKQKLYQDETPYRYAIQKNYVSQAFDIKAKPGDLILIYRIGERYPKKYSSVISGLSILQDIETPSSKNNFIKTCINKSIFDEKELNTIWDPRQTKVIKLIFYESFNKKVILDKLQKLCIIKEGNGPRPFTKITIKQYKMILSEAGKKDE